MTSLFSSPWFYWALGVAVALPTLLVVLTEVEHVLSRRSSPLVRPLHLIRVLLTEVEHVLSRRSSPLVRPLHLIRV
ncbi:hypothetical protein H7H98_18135, partial [Mycolicibacterium sphagni]|nr:hypothetical protein [Mycolicibacterium sphagni]